MLQMTELDAPHRMIPPRMKGWSWKWLSYLRRVLNIEWRNPYQQAQSWSLSTHQSVSWTPKQVIRLEWTIGKRLGTGAQTGWPKEEWCLKYQHQSPKNRLGMFFAFGRECRLSRRTRQRTCCSPRAQRRSLQRSRIHFQHCSERCRRKCRTHSCLNKWDICRSILKKWES